VNKTTEDN